MEVDRSSSVRPREEHGEIFRHMFRENNKKADALTRIPEGPPVTHVAVDRISPDSFPRLRAEFDGSEREGAVG